MIAVRAALRGEVGMTVQEPVGSSSSTAVLEIVARIGDGNGASARQLMPMSARAPDDRGEQRAGIGQAVELFDEATVVRLLVEIGELDGDTMLGSALTVQNYSRRNRCLIVHGAGRGWVVKQGTDAETVQSVCREIQIYMALRDGAVQFATPRLVYEDHDGAVLIVEYVTGVPLRDALVTGSPFDPVRVAGVLGNLLASMHSCSLVDKFTELPSPWILDIFRPRLEMLPGLSGGSVELISLLQSHPHVCDALARLADTWEPIAMTHNDLRGDNLIIPADPRQATFIDWELGGRGDPHWDLAGLLAEQLMRWLTGLRPPASPAGEARYADAAQTVAPVHQFAGALLRGYTQPDSATRGDPVNLSALMCWCATWLVQNALETAQRYPTLDSASRELLQVAVNMLERPTDAGRWLFGLADGYAN